MNTGKTGEMDEAQRARLEAAGWKTGDYGDFLGLTDEERAIVESRLELQRLEREVIDAAKAWRHRKSTPTEGRLFNAVCDLESFEAKQKQ